MNQPLISTDTIATLKATIAQLEAGALTPHAARKLMSEALPEGETMTEEEATALLAEFPDIAKGPAAKDIVALLMTNAAGGRELLEEFRQSGELENQCTAEEAWKLIEPYNLQGRGRSVLIDLLQKDKAAGERILAGLPKLTAPEMPVAPQHDPCASADPQDAEGKARRLRELIEEIKKEGRYTDYTSAREEARRRKPGLFS